MILVAFGKIMCLKWLNMNIIIIIYLFIHTDINELFPISFNSFLHFMGIFTFTKHFFVWKCPLCFESNSNI